MMPCSNESHHALLDSRAYPGKALEKAIAYPGKALEKAIGSSLRWNKFCAAILHVLSEG